MASNQPRQQAEFRRAVMWLALGSALLALPYLIPVVPSWLAWLPQGTTGGGRTWQLMGGIMTAFGAVELLSSSAQHFKSPALFKVSRVATMVLLGAGLVFAFGSILLFGGLVLTFIGVDQGNAPFLIIGALAAMLAAAFGLAFWRLRKLEPDDLQVQAVGTAAAYVLGPPGFLLLIAVKSLFWTAALMFATSHVVPSFAPWIDTNGRAVMITAMVASMVVTLVVWASLRARKPDGDSFLGACSTVMLGLTIGCPALLGLMGAVLAWRHYS